MSRATKLLIATGVVVFLGISLLLARYLSTENRERNAVYALLRDQARGDARGVLRRLDGCDARCRAAVETNVRRLARPGAVKILAYNLVDGLRARQRERSDPGGVDHRQPPVARGAVRGGAADGERADRASD